MRRLIAIGTAVALLASAIGPPAVSAAAPTNDNFADATVITSLPYAQSVSLTDASKEIGEPQCSYPSVGTVWFQYTPGDNENIMAWLPNWYYYSPVLGIYTGTSVDALVSLWCTSYSAHAFIAQAGVTYYFQVSDVWSTSGSGTFRLEPSPPPSISFGWYPTDPSTTDTITFNDYSSLPGGPSYPFETRYWDFGDGTTAVRGQYDNSVTHRYDRDGDYTVSLTDTAFDGRTATGSATVSVRTHDVSMTSLAAPVVGQAGRTVRVAVSVSNARYPETVQVQLYSGHPAQYPYYAWQLVGTLTQSVPARRHRTVPFMFNYTFTSADAVVGKVSFRAVATIQGFRDSFPADNELIAPPTKVTR